MSIRIFVGDTYTDGIANAFLKKGVEVVRFKMPARDSGKELYYQLLDEYEVRERDFIFTLDFFPELSEACYKRHVKYISWVWDSPHASLWSKKAHYDTNYIFLFDYFQYIEQQRRGMENVFYLPIGSDAEFFQKVIAEDSGNNKGKYASEISFVGNLYSEEQYDLLSKVKYIPPYTKGYIDGILAAQRNIWGADLIGTCISTEVWNSLKEYIKWDLGERYDEGVYEATMKNVFGQKIAQMERTNLCSELAKRYDFRLYTKSDTSYDKRIVNCGYADYKSMMPLIFYYSKININITSRSIKSGIPLRVMDVLASGGFLLTNYQHEIAEYFDDGVDLVIFEDYEDLYEKADYYLKHEDERKKIAGNGYRKVTDIFPLVKQIDTIINTIY